MLISSFDFTVKQKEPEGRKKGHKGGKKSQAEDETEPTQAGHWKQDAFSIQLALMPLLAGSYTCSSSFWLSRHMWLECP